MVELLEEAVRLGAELPVETATEIARSENLRGCLKRIGPASRREPLQALFRKWQGLPESGFGIALLTAALARRERDARESLELVWTGPDSNVIPVRQTEQVLLDLITNSRKTLLVVSYAVYRIPRISETLLAAIDRGVRVTLVLDLNNADEIVGYNPLLAIRRDLRARAQVLYWPMECRAADSDGKRGTLHVKCVVADADRMFVSSANLTDQAFRLNMELGVLVTGNRCARDVEEHFAALRTAGTLAPLKQDSVV